MQNGTSQNPTLITTTVKLVESLGHFMLCSERCKMWQKKNQIKWLSNKFATHTSCLQSYIIQMSCEFMVNINIFIRSKRISTMDVRSLVVRMHQQNGLNFTGIFLSEEDCLLRCAHKRVIHRLVFAYCQLSDQMW